MEIIGWTLDLENIYNHPHLGAEQAEVGKYDNNFWKKKICIIKFTGQTTSHARKDLIVFFPFFA